MKSINILKRGIFKTLPVMGGLVGLLSLSSCEDWLTIYPTDKTVAEDFWKTKSDVDGMVAGCYQKMIAYSCTERAIIWGAYRSDELVKNETNYSNTTLENIASVNLEPTNGYSNWSSFYSVINACNIVLNHAEGVMELDPEYTEGDYQVTKANMLALRSLCYFYLVRAFRDVPYTTQSYEDDDQVMTIAQSCPDSVLAYCIRDLEEARQYIVKSGAYGDWRDKGYFTRDAIDALMCDIYLWRGSMKKDASDYQMASQYADNVIQAKHEYYENHYSSSMSTDPDDIYHLESGSTALSTIFYEGNSTESILELQYDGENNSNTALANYYSGYDVDHRDVPILKASQIFNVPNENANTANGSKVYASTTDYRFWNNVADVNAESAEQLPIRKYLATTDIRDISSRSTGVDISSLSKTDYESFKRNWIVYRLSDVMLMKAEAETQLADTASDEHIQKAFDLVQAVYKRSQYSVTDTLVRSSYTTKENMELLVLAERERELCFEGKRWFDLVRYAYRHMTTMPNTNGLMADTKDWPSLPSQMVKFVTRKYVSGGDAVTFRMKQEPYLYWPIRRAEIKVNSLLKQNPVFEVNESTSKN